MGTTINGVYQGGKQLRRRKALARLEANHKRLTKEFKETVYSSDTLLQFTANNIKRVEQEIETLRSRV